MHFDRLHGPNANSPRVVKKGGPLSGPISGPPMMTVVPSGAFHGGARLFRHATPIISSKNRRAVKLKPIQPVSAPHALKGNLVYANPERAREYRALALQLRAISAAMS